MRLITKAGDDTPVLICNATPRARNAFAHQHHQLRDHYFEGRKIIWCTVFEILTKLCHIRWTVGHLLQVLSVDLRIVPTVVDIEWPTGFALNRHRIRPDCQSGVIQARRYDHLATQGLSEDIVFGTSISD